MQGHKVSQKPTRTMVTAFRISLSFGVNASLKSSPMSRKSLSGDDYLKNSTETTTK